MIDGDYYYVDVGFGTKTDIDSYKLTNITLVDDNHYILKIEIANKIVDEERENYCYKVDVEGKYILSYYSIEYRLIFKDDHWTFDIFGFPRVYDYL